MTKQEKKEMQARIDEREKSIIEYQKRTGHARPKTRREFLASGALSFSGVMFAPSFLTQFMRAIPAFAAECDAAGGAAGGGSTMVPFVTINLQGGWSAVANWLPRDIGGQMLPSYGQLGNGTAPTPVTAFANNALFSPTSSTAGFLSGVQTAATAATMGKTSFIGMPVSSGDDTGNDRFAVGGLLSAAGLAGTKLPILGTAATPTGIRMQPALGIASPAPLQVGNVNDILNALGSAGTLANGLNANQQRSVMLSLIKTVKNLSDTQARALASESGGQKVLELVGCSTQKNMDNVTAGAASVDPRTNASLATNATTATPGANGAPLWNFGNANELAQSAMIMNALTGNAGSVGITLGGYDYHGNSRATTDTRDRAAGRLAGQIIETAAKLNSPVFIYIVSDGSVVFQNSANAGTQANGDSGNRGAVLMMAFNPTAAPVAKSSQIGGFTTGQAANTAFVTNWNADKAGAAAFVNWAMLSKAPGMIQSVIPNVFSANELSLVNMFG